MAFKDNLKRIKLLRGVKSMDIVRGIGVKKQLYYAWEAGKYAPSEDNLDLLCDYFKVRKPLFYEEDITEDKLNQFSTMKAEKQPVDEDWYKKTIDSLIHINGEGIKEFRESKKDEIEELKQDKIRLHQHVTSLIAQVNPPHNGQ